MYYIIIIIIPQTSTHYNNIHFSGKKNTYTADFNSST